MLGDFFDALFGSSRQKRLQQEQLELQKKAFEHQQLFDNEQLALQRKPISILMSDAKANGINPMAAMGQSVGSASSSVQSPSAMPTSIDSQLAPLMSLLGNVLSQKMHNESTERMHDKDLKMQDKDLKLQEQYLAEQKAENLRVDARASKQLALDKLSYEIEKDRNSWQKLHSREQLNFTQLDHWHKVAQDAIKNLNMAALTDIERQRVELAQEQLAQAKETSDKDRRQRYISSALNSIAIVANAALGMATGSATSSSSIYIPRSPSYTPHNVTEGSIIMSRN